MNNNYTTKMIDEKIDDAISSVQDDIEHLTWKYANGEFDNDKNFVEPDYEVEDYDRYDDEGQFLGTDYFFAVSNEDEIADYLADKILSKNDVFAKTEAGKEIRELIVKEIGVTFASDGARDQLQERYNAENNVYEYIRMSRGYRY